MDRGGAVIVVERIGELRTLLDGHRSAGRTVGLVPTMGSLHAGHRSLLDEARRRDDVVVASVFVNPLQFGPTEDLGAYPRDLAADAAVCEAAGVDIVFAPDVAEMYPDGPPLTVVRVERLSDTLEGVARPTHLAGVATVVAKLFAVVGAGRAYFGEKDYQQLRVVTRMAADLSLPVGVVGCPTVREPDGLALSSRNAYLTPGERAVASALHEALRAGAEAVRAGVDDPAEVRAVMEERLAREPRFETGYLAVADAATLEVPDRCEGELRLLGAARLGAARLIDNVGVVAPTGAIRLDSAGRDGDGGRRPEP